jgi:hypothetical protein
MPFSAGIHSRGCFGFQMVGLAFDVDSIYSERHYNFKMQYEAQFTRGSWELRTKSLPVSFLQGICPIICDHKHLVKRIRYRFMSSSQFSIGFGTEERFFSLSRIQQAGFLPDIVFDNSQITKIHDLLPLYLFSFDRSSEPDGQDA